MDVSCLGHYLKIWADKWACFGEYKGGTVPLMYEVFVVTSNYSIEELFASDATLAKAIARRFNVVEFRNKYVPSTDVPPIPPSQTSPRHPFPPEMGGLTID